MNRFRPALLGLAAGAVLALAVPGASAEGFGDRGSLRDGPHRAPFNWTGLYLGAELGYGVGTTEFGGEADVSLRGAQGVVVAGYNFQLGRQWVLGVFADYAFGELDGSFEDIKFSIDNQLAIGGRLGLLATPTTLLYASAGYTRADFSNSDIEIFNRALAGFFVGLGFEQALTSNLSLKLDYRFSDYESFSIDDFKLDNDIHSVRLGFNWRFGRGDRATPN